MTKVESDLFKAPKHIIDPYERKDQMALQDKRMKESKKRD